MDLTAALHEIDEFLGCPTPSAWLHQALEYLPELLIDHANCEKKAASTALGLTYRYDLPERALVTLSKLAREELRHFEQVLALMPAVGVRYGPLSAGTYAAQLRRLVAAREPARLVDTLLVCAIVEARSCERFSKLLTVLESPLQDFYQRLLMSEARHYRMYVDLANEQARIAELDATLACDSETSYCRIRLLALLAQEAQLIQSPAQEFRFHSGPLATS